MSTKFRSKVPVRIALATAALCAPLVVGGCSAQWTSMSPSISSTRPSATPSPTSTAKIRTEGADHVALVAHTSPAHTGPASTGPAPTGSAPSSPSSTGDLDRGSLRHPLPLGDHLLVVNYWTDSSAGNGVVHLSAALKGADRKHAVKVTRFSASLIGSSSSPVQLADDQGEFVLTPPYSYTTALSVPPASTAQTGSRTLSVRFDLLIETAPGSGAYFRQSVLDDVVLSRGTASAPTTSTEGATR